MSVSFRSAPQSVDRQWLGLLERLAAVRDELKLTLAQEEKLDAVWKSKRLPKDATPLQREKNGDETTRLVEGILSPEQLVRLKQIYLQQNLTFVPTARMLILPNMVSVLGISEDQRKKLEELASKPSAKPAGLNADNEAALAILTPQQREKFDRAKGAKFRTNLRLFFLPIDMVATRLAVLQRFSVCRTS